VGCRSRTGTAPGLVTISGLTSIAAVARFFVAGHWNPVGGVVSGVEWCGVMCGYVGCVVELRLLLVACSCWWGSSNVRSTRVDQVVQWTSSGAYIYLA
jgi:hypothetical protein